MEKRELARSTFGGIMVAGIVLFVFLTGYRVVAGITFNQNCSGRLKRAADAITLQMAQNELDAAIGYADRNHLTSGYTSIVYQTPDEDVGFWYTNLVESRDELKVLISTTEGRSPLEDSNQLMKLRQTLLDHSGEGGERVTKPSGIEIYPHNGTVLLGFVASIVMAIFGFLGFDANKERSFSRSKRSGITVIELLIILLVVAIIAMIGAISVAAVL